MDAEFPGSADLLKQELGKLHAQLAELRQTLFGRNPVIEPGAASSTASALAGREVVAAGESLSSEASASLCGQEALREVHQVMRNSLHLIAGMLELRTSRTIELPRLLRDSRNRIDALGFLHQVLSRSASAAHVDLALYLVALTSHLYDCFGVDEHRVRREVNVSAGGIDFDTAVRVGLLINELVSNALEHAFPDNAAGRLAICVRAEEQGLVVEVSDDGIGLPREIDLDQVETPGLRLATTLVRQAGGKMILDRSRGTTFLMTLPAPSGGRGDP